MLDEECFFAPPSPFASTTPSYTIWRRSSNNWQLFHLGGFVVVWWQLLCVQLLALLSGSVSSGVAWASLCVVWVPTCIGCTCLVALLCDV